MTIEIQLTRGKISIIDDSDFELVSPIHWFFDPGTRSKNGYAKGKPGRVTMYMHRLILGARRGQLVDHINRDSLDNRRCNLRFVTPGQSAANIEYEPSASGFRGVHPLKKSFRAIIMADKKVYRGRCRPSADLAALDYDRMARQFYGEFAITNFAGNEIQ